MRRVNGANIMFLLREGVAKDWESLCREFGFAPAKVQVDTLVLDLRDRLFTLREIGLIEFEEDANAPERIKGSITVSEHWTNIHKALGGQKLAEIAKLDSSSVVVKPYFRRPQKAGKQNDLFVLMPFAEELKPVYDDHIKKVVHALELTVARADDFFTAHEIIIDIWAAIRSAHTIIADCTGRNPNVFYEIGLAHAIGKTVILITQNADDVPFDLQQLRYIRYELTPQGMKTFEESLEKTLKAALDL